MVTDDAGVLVEVVGEGAGRCRSTSRTSSSGRCAPPSTRWARRSRGFILRCANTIPHGRGLGSSAAAIVGGIVLARALVADGRERMTDSDVLQLALRQEGHPDNLAAALYGGFTVAWLEDDGFADAVRMDPHPDVRPGRAGPADRSCRRRRPARCCPPTVPFADAAHNVSRAALLVHALTADPRRLMAATEDRLHQQAPARVPTRTRSPWSRRLRASGVPAVISGRRTHGAGLRRRRSSLARGRVRRRARLARAAASTSRPRAPGGPGPAPALTARHPGTGRHGLGVMLAHAPAYGGMPVHADNCPSCDTVALDAPTRFTGTSCPVGYEPLAPTRDSSRTPRTSRATPSKETS